MKYVENQVSSAISDIRSRIQGKVNPERMALDTANKIDSARLRSKIPDQEEDDTTGYTEDNRNVLIEDHFRSPITDAVSLSKDSLDEQTEKDIFNGTLRKIVAKSSWDNPFIEAAIPSLLILLPIISNSAQPNYDTIALKLQFIKEIEKFQKTLLSKQYLSEDVDHLAYMLCTFLNEKLTEKKINFDASLLVQFYRDAWGGEKCFEHLEEYLEKPNQNKLILEFYDLFLSLGFLGKYGLIDKGSILLNSLKSKLKNILFGNPEDDLTYLLSYDISARKGILITPLRLFLGLLALFLLLYLLISLYLHSLSRDLRNEIAAWQPPVLATIRENPPPELIAILKEGWLQIREHPQGWLLIFTSDGAFNVGSYELTKEFKQKKNLERLGNALANYPGDLVVIGHTDNTPYAKGSSGSNLQLSIDRAKTVAGELQNGTSINSYNHRKITYDGKGESEPLASNNTVAGRKKNRRVDILWKIGRKEKDEVMRILNEENENVKDSLIENPDTI